MNVEKKPGSGLTFGHGLDSRQWEFEKSRGQV
jgi:hypothetical protein